MRVAHGHRKADQVLDGIGVGQRNENLLWPAVGVAVDDGLLHRYLAGGAVGGQGTDGAGE